MTLRSSDFVLAMIAVLFPPLTVWIKSGIFSVDSLLNIVLCILGYFPGLLHAWYIIVKDAEAREGRAGYQDIESARPVQHDEYGAIAQFDRTYKQTSGVRDGARDGPTYADVVAGSTSNNANASSDNPPSYSAVVKGDHKVQH